MVHSSGVRSEEPCLDRSQRNRTCHRSLFNAHPVCFGDERCQFCNKGMQENIPYLQLQVLVFQSGYNLNGLDRIAAQCEVIVPDPDVFSSQYIFPYTDQCLFRGISGRFINRACARVCILGLRQSSPVNLPVVRQLERIHGYKMGRNHIIRQPCAEIAPKLGDIRGFSFGLEHKIGHQPLIPGMVFPRHDYGFPNRRMLMKCSFDFAQFNAESPDFHLMICSAQKFDVAVREIQGKVPGFIKLRVRFAGKRIRDKGRGRFFRIVQIASAHADAAHIQFSHNANGHGLQPGIQNIELHIDNRTSNGHVRNFRSRGLVNAVMRHIIGTFGGTISIQHRNLGKMGQPLRAQFWRQSLAGGNQPAQPG